MNDLSTILAMGGYGAYVWPAYGLTLVAFVAMLGWTLRTLASRRRMERELAALGRARPVRARGAGGPRGEP